MRIPLVGPSYKQDALSFDVQRSINFFPLNAEVPNTKEPTSLRGTPGYTLFSSVGGGPHRGSIVSTRFNRAFFVSGMFLYEVLADGTATQLGELLTATNRVGVAQNFTQIIIVDGANGYIFDMETNTFSQITDVNFPGATDVDYTDGYFIIIEPGTGRAYISALNNGLDWDPLDFTNIESNPDNLVAVKANRGLLFFFGTRSIEAYQNQPIGTQFPFRRIEGSQAPTGCAATFSVQRFNDTIAWLGVDDQGRGVVWRIANNSITPQRISTRAIERLINSTPDFTESYAWVYHEQGNIFYMLQVTGLDTTLVYDGSTDQWHERQNAGTQQHRGATHIFFAQKNLIGDRLNGNIYEMGLDKYDENGEEIIRTRFFPHIQDEKKLIFHDRLELDLETGRGLVTGQGSDPKVVMQYSDDGGRTFSSELWRSAGPIGVYGQRVYWDRLGQARDRVYKIQVSDPVFWQINGGYLNAT